MKNLKAVSVSGLGVVAVLVMALSLQSCGKDKKLQLVKDINLKTYELEGDSYGEVQAVLDLGNLRLPGFSFPIADPRKPGVSYGRVSSRETLDGFSELAVAVNLSRLAQMGGMDDVLPNGNQIPIGGLGDAQLIGVEIPNVGIRVYVALGEGVALFGVAVPIKQFDSIGSKLGLADLFIPFNVKGVRGTAGVFTGKGDGQNGLALFADVGGLLDQLTPDQAGALMAAHSIRSSQTSSQIGFPSVAPSRKKEDKLRKEIYLMNVEKKKLTLH